MAISIKEFRLIANLVKQDLVRMYGHSFSIFFDGDFRTAKSAITPDLNIVLDLDNILDMVDGIHCICHEYCHCLRETEAGHDSRLREFHEFYLNECQEYHDHDLFEELGYQVYWYSLLELDARAFEESFGTEYMDHYFEVLNPSQLREAYANSGASALVELIRETFGI